MVDQVMRLEGFFEVSPVLRSGVYALVDFGEVVYVGKAKELYARIYAHRLAYRQKRNGKRVISWMSAKAFRFDTVWVRPCKLYELDKLEREMIELYKPRYNTRLKTEAKIDVEIPLQIRGMTVVLNNKTLGMAEPSLFQRRV